MRGLRTLVDLAAIAAGFVEGFALASLVACVGPLAVLGAFATGLLTAVQRP
jgi:uncharacterized membrane protein YqgA involved in biofilm formation